MPDNIKHTPEKRYFLLAEIIILIMVILSSCTLVTRLQKGRIKINEEDVKIAGEYYNRALEELKKDNVYSALVYLYRAKNKNPADKRISEKYKSTVNSLNARISGTQEIIKKGRGMSHPIVYTLSRTIYGITKPVSGMPVYFTLLNAGGKLTEEDITNNEGAARCYIERIDNYNKSVKVEASVWIPDRKTGEKLDSLTRIFTYTRSSVTDKNIKIVVQKKAEINESMDILMDTLMEDMGNQLNIFLQDLSFSSVAYIKYIKNFVTRHTITQQQIKNLGEETSSEVIILVTLSSITKIQQSTDFYLVNIDTNINILNTSKGVVCLSNNVTGRGAGSNISDALNRAFFSCLSGIKKLLESYLKEVEVKNEFFIKRAE